MNKLQKAIAEAEASEDELASYGLFTVTTRRAVNDPTYIIKVEMSGPIDTSLESTDEPTEADIKELAHDIDTTVFNLVSDFKKHYKKNNA